MKRPSGAQSGVIVGLASLVSIGLNYVFLLAAGRLLGSEDYGALAALLGLLTLLLLPTGAIQLAVSRETSRQIALDETRSADAFGWAAYRLGLIATLPILVVALILAVPLGEALKIDAPGIMLLTAFGLATALTFPVAMGVLQGHQRFLSIAAMQVIPSALRLVLLGIGAVVGLRLGGAVGASVVAGIAAIVLATALAREPLGRGFRRARPDLGPFLRYLWPVLIGLIGISVLTTVDLLVVKSRFAADAAGEYAAASAFARIAFFVPATILTVLFPVTAARHARGEETRDILGRSLLVTAAFGSLLALFYGMTGRGLMRTSFGAEFADGGDLLVLFTVSMTLYALVNVLVGFHLSRGETRYAWIVAGAVPIQLAILATIPASSEDVILANIVVGAALLAVHELLVDTTVFAVAAGLRHFGSQAARAGFRAPVVREGVVVVLGATLFVAALFWPVVTALGSTVIGDGSDASGRIAELWRMQYEGGYHLFGETHHTLTGAPFGWDEGNGLNIQLLIPYYPAYLATKLVGPVAAYNLVLLAGYVLSGASMYLLVRYLGCARAVAAWAGLAYIVFPAHLVRTPHGSLVHLEVLPLLLLALLAAAERPSGSRFSLVGLATLACWLTSGYFGVMAVVSAAAFALAAALAAPVRRAAVVIAGSIAAAVGATLVLGVLSIISGFGRGAGLDRVAGELEVYGVRPLELLLPSPGNFVFGDWAERFFSGRQHGSGPTETRNYVGLLTLGFVLAWLVIAVRHRHKLEQRLRLATLGLTGVGLAALLLAAPSPVSVLGREVWMPSRALWELIPAIRVPSRWIAMVMTALIPLAALALQVAWKKAAEAGKQRAAYALVAIVVCVSFLELGVNPSRPRFETSPAPRLYSALKRVPDGIVAEYPLLVSNDHVIWQTIYRRPMFGNADFGTRADDARRIVLNPRVPGTAEALAFLGVTAIITPPDALRYVDSASDAPNASWGPGYKLVARVPDGSSVWHVIAVAAPALVTLTGGFGEPITNEKSFVGYPLVSPSGVGVIEFTAKAPSTVRLEFDATAPRPEQMLRLADADREISFDLTPKASIAVLVDVPRGHSYLTVKTDPAATSEEDAIVLSKPRAVRAFGMPALVAQTISADPGF